MLKTRIITALCMLAVLIAVLNFGGAQGFAAFCAILTVLAAWEWARLLGWQGNMTIYYGAIVGGVMFVLHAAQLEFPHAPVVRTLWGVSAAFWFLYVPFALFKGVQAQSTLRSMGLAIAGCVILPACWFAIVAAYQVSTGYLLSVLVLVWAADVGAYFAGRAFGKRKLAPQISPGKSWEGVIGGVCLVFAIAILALQLDWLNPTVYSRLWSSFGAVLSVILLASFVALSVMGDLFESLIKRQAGMKDSSQLLPGHGGILDRLDALLPVLPITALLLL